MSRYRLTFRLLMQLHENHHNSFLLTAKENEFVTSPFAIQVPVVEKSWTHCKCLLLQSAWGSCWHSTYGPYMPSSLTWVRISMLNLPWKVRNCSSNNERIIKHNSRTANCCHDAAKCTNEPGKKVIILALAAFDLYSLQSKRTRKVLRNYSTRSNSFHAMRKETDKVASGRDVEEDVLLIDTKSFLCGIDRTCDAAKVLRGDLKYRTVFKRWNLGSFRRIFIFITVGNREYVWRWCCLWFVESVVRPCFSQAVRARRQKNKCCFQNIRESLEVEYPKESKEASILFKIEDGMQS